MQRTKSFLGYTAAALTVLAAVLIPFVLMNAFTNGVAALGLRIDPAYVGGPTVRTIARGGYSIAVSETVRASTPLQRLEPYVRLTWTPVAALPRTVSDTLDLDGDGRDDVRVTFAVPRDETAPLRFEARALTPLAVTVASGSRATFSLAIARTKDAIIVHVPVNESGRR